MVGRNDDLQPAFKQRCEFNLRMKGLFFADDTIQFAIMKLVGLMGRMNRSYGDNHSRVLTAEFDQDSGEEPTIYQRTGSDSKATGSPTP